MDSTVEDRDFWHCIHKEAAHYQYIVIYLSVDSKKTTNKFHFPFASLPQELPPLKNATECAAFWNTDCFTLEHGETHFHPGVLSHVNRFPTDTDMRSVSITVFAQYVSGLADGDQFNGHISRVRKSYSKMFCAPLVPLPETLPDYGKIRLFYLSLHVFNYFNNASKTKTQ